MIRYFTLPCF